MGTLAKNRLRNTKVRTIAVKLSQTQRCAKISIKWRQTPHPIYFLRCDATIWLKKSSILFFFLSHVVSTRPLSLTTQYYQSLYKLLEKLIKTQSRRRVVNLNCSHWNSNFLTSHGSPSYKYPLPYIGKPVPMWDLVLKDKYFNNNDISIYKYRFCNHSYKILYCLKFKWNLNLFLMSASLTERRISKDNLYIWVPRAPLRGNAVN